jgi:hypothetical protein
MIRVLFIFNDKILNDWCFFSSVNITQFIKILYYIQRLRCSNIKFYTYVLWEMFVPLQKIQIFCGRCSFFVPNMGAKNREKVQLLGHIFGPALWKKQRFYMIRSKNKNKSRLSRNATKIYRHLYKKMHIDRWCAKFHNISNKCRFFLFFQLRFYAFRLKILKKSRLIRNVTKLCIEVWVKFCRILNKFRFILSTETSKNTTWTVSGVNS